MTLQELVRLAESLSTHGVILVSANVEQAAGSPKRVRLDLVLTDETPIAPDEIVVTFEGVASFPTPAPPRPLAPF